MIANKDFSNDYSSNPSESSESLPVVPPMNSIAFQRVVIACLIESGVAANEICRTSLTYSLRVPTRKKPARLLISFQRRIGRIGLVFEPAKLEIDWEKILSKFPTQKQIQEKKKIKSGYRRLYGNTITLSDQPLANCLYGLPYNIVNDF